MILYADTSALAKLVIEEVGSSDVRAAQQSAETIATAAIGYVELRAAAAAAVRAGRMQARELVRAVELLWNKVSPIDIDFQLLRLAGDMAERFGLRGYDAVHLAALQSAGPPDVVVFSCWDADLRRAAVSLGYALLPVA